MKVLYLTNLPTPYRVEFFNELGSMCDLTVLYERKTAKNRQASWLQNVSVSYKEVFLKGISIGDENSLCFDVINWLSNNSYDIIVIGGYSTLTGMFAISYLNFKKKPFVLNSDGGFVKLDNKLKYIVKKHFISSAQFYLSTSNTTDKYLINYGASSKNIYRYPFTSLKKENIRTKSLSVYEKRFLRTELNIDYDFLIVSVGQFIHRKGFDVLIKASKELSENTGVYIIGGEPTEEYLNLIEKFSIDNVHFVNFLSKEVLEKYLLSADVFVLPTREDIWGLVINEAMSYGLPVITTDKCVAGLELIKSDFNGYIVDSDNVDEIVNKINDLNKDRNKLLSMSNNCIDIIQNYSIEKMALEHHKIFKRMKGEIDANNI